MMRGKGNTEHITGIISFLIMSCLLLIIPQHDVVNKTTNYHPILNFDSILKSGQDCVDKNATFSRSGGPNENISLKMMNITEMKVLKIDDHL